MGKKFDLVHEACQHEQEKFMTAREIDAIEQKEAFDKRYAIYVKITRNRHSIERLQDRVDSLNGALPLNRSEQVKEKMKREISCHYQEIERLQRENLSWEGRLKDLFVVKENRLLARDFQPVLY